MGLRLGGLGRKAVNCPNARSALLRAPNVRGFDIADAIVTAKVDVRGCPASQRIIRSVRPPLPSDYRESAASGRSRGSQDQRQSR
jgi:hypothetical protein